MTLIAVFRLLLVEENDLLASRLVAIASAVSSVVRFKSAKEAENWLNHASGIDLIVASEKTGRRMVTVARRLPASWSIPILTIHNAMDDRLVVDKPDSGANDVLIVNDDNNSIRSRIRYYLDLNRRVLSSSSKAPSLRTRWIGVPWWKRTIDIAVSLTALLLLSPLLVLVAILIKLDSKGPIFYKSKRAGTNFFVFDMYKFRTMRVQADQQLADLSANNIYAKVSDTRLDENFICSVCRQEGIPCQQLLFDHNQPICEKLYMARKEDAAKFMKFRNDPRITRLGTFLRNSSIDELPQLFNILFGNMSLVGNRPLPLYEAEKLTTDELAQRFAGPAGLTGLWQIKKRAKGQGPMSDKERMALDIEYATTFSFKTDMYIIWRTIFSLWQQENV